MDGFLSLSGFMRVSLDQQRGYCRDELGRCERLAERQTVGDAFRWPIGRAVTADIDHWQVWDEFSPAAGNLPAVRSSAKTDIGYKSTKTRRVRFEFAQRLSALRYVADIEPGLYKTFFQIVPDECLVLYQQKRLCRRHSLAFSSRQPTGDKHHRIEGHYENSRGGDLVPVKASYRVMSFGDQSVAIRTSKASKRRLTKSNRDGACGQDGLCATLRGFAHQGKREGFGVAITSTAVNGAAKALCSLGDVPLIRRSQSDDTSRV